MNFYPDGNPKLVKELLEKLLAKVDLTSSQMINIIDLFSSGILSSSQIAALLIALKSKGETSLEIASAAMRMKSIIPELNVDLPHLIDVCGTGGDSRNTFNISTASMFVIAGAGGYVAKHGSGAISSVSGSSDLLSELGVNIDLPREKIIDCLHETGIGFFLSPNFHSIWESVGQARYEIGVRTLFNLLGPLANPVNIKCQMIGVYSRDLIKPLIKSLEIMGLKHALVISASNGMDEISLVGETSYAELFDGKITYGQINPKDFGFCYRSIEDYMADISVINPSESKDKVIKALNSKEGSVFDTIIFNAGAGIYVSNLADSLAEGIEMARYSIISGSAMSKLKKFVSFTRGGI